MANEAENLCKELYFLAEELEELALHAREQPEELAGLHFRIFSLKQRILRTWIQFKHENGMP